MHMHMHMHTCACNTRACSVFVQKFASLSQVDNFLQYGAELEWCSAFPAEAEVCAGRMRT